MKNNLSILFIFLLFPINLFSQIKWDLNYDSANFAFLVLDYNTYNFEGGYFTKFKYTSGYDKNGIPFKIVYNPPMDYGNILFSYSATNDTIFAADIWWAGWGGIKYPKIIENANQFTFDSTIVINPYSFEYFHYMNEISSVSFHTKADIAWNSVKKVSILKEFDKNGSVFRVGLYLFAPAVGMFRPDLAKWIIFLYRGQLIVGLQNVIVNPAEYSLLQNYPNPFNPLTNIEFSLAKAEHVKIFLYDLLGRRVGILLDEYKDMGQHKIVFDGSNYASGTYFYKITTSNYSKTKKLLLIK